MGFLDKLMGPKQAYEPEDKQRGDVVSNPAFALSLQPACEVVPAGSGPFGCVTNPVPANGVRGELVYLNSLRSASSGAGYFYHRLGSTRSPNVPTPIDVYELVAKDAAEWRVLYMTPYHPRRSKMAPAWAKNADWPKQKEAQLMLKLPTNGMPDAVSNFPLALPDLVRHSDMLNQIAPSLATSVADRIEKELTAHRGAWQRPKDLNVAPLHSQIQ